VTFVTVINNPCYYPSPFKKKLYAISLNILTCMKGKKKDKLVEIGYYWKFTVFYKYVVWKNVKSNHVIHMLLICIQLLWCVVYDEEPLLMFVNCWHLFSSILLSKNKKYCMYKLLQFIHREEIPIWKKKKKKLSAISLNILTCMKGKKKINLLK